jgi:hypothetical protein
MPPGTVEGIFGLRLPERVFGYWFDFGDDWYHQVQVERIEQAIPTVTYARIIKRVGKSPPQYAKTGSFDRALKRFEADCKLLSALRSL